MKTILVFILCIFSVVFLKAQEQNKLTVPGTPAFSILDYEPTSVMKPASAKELSTDILNSFDSKGKLLTNLGLEFSPYWLKSHPNLSKEKFLNPTPGQLFLQSLAFSFATVKDTSTNSNKFGAGFRFKIANGKPTAEYQKKYANAIRDSTTSLTLINQVRTNQISDSTFKTTRAALNYCLKLLKEGEVQNELILEVKTNALAIIDDYSNTESDIIEFLDALIKKLNEIKRPLYETVSKKMYDRTGFSAEISGATAFNNSNNNDLEKAGVWGNLTYYISPDDFLTFTARYLNHNSDTSTSNFDAGLSYLKKTDKFNISVEALARWYSSQLPELSFAGTHINKTEREFSYRFAIQGSYNISKDISLNVSFGKDFKSPFITRSAFFSIFGLSYNIFSKQPETVKEK